MYRSPKIVADVQVSPNCWVPRIAKRCGASQAEVLLPAVPLLDPYELNVSASTWKSWTLAQLKANESVDYSLQCHGCFGEEHEPPNNKDLLLHWLPDFWDLNILVTPSWRSVQQDTSRWPPRKGHPLHRLHLLVTMEVPNVKLPTVSGTARMVTMLVQKKHCGPHATPLHPTQSSALSPVKGPGMNL